MSSIMRRRNGLIASSVMGDAPVLSEVANSSSSRQDASSRYRVAVPAARGALPRERFSPLALLGPREMSDLHPQWPTRTLIRSLTNRDFMSTRPGRRRARYHAPHENGDTVAR